MSYAEITEEIYSLNYQDKLSLKTLIEKYLIEDRRKEILKNHQEATRMANNGELGLSSNTYELMSMLQEYQFRFHNCF